MPYSNSIKRGMILIVLLLSLNLVLSSECPSGIYPCNSNVQFKNQPTITSTSVNNNTLNVNNSQYLQGYTPTQVANLFTESDPIYSANTYATGMNQGVTTTSNVIFNNINFTGNLVSNDNVFNFDGTNHNLTLNGNLSLGNSTDNLRIYNSMLPTANPQYSNSGGTGDRRSLIGVSTTIGVAGGSVGILVDGSYGTSAYFLQTTAVGTYLRFDFGASASKVITEAKWYQGGSDTWGNWKWQGSNDAVTWTDIGNIFAWGGSTNQILTELSSNTNGYRYYQLYKTDTTAFVLSSQYFKEMEFKIDKGSNVRQGFIQSYSTNGSTPSNLNIQTSGGNTIIGNVGIDSVGNANFPGTLTSGGLLTANNIFITSNSQNSIYTVPTNGRLVMGNFPSIAISNPTQYVVTDISLFTQDGVDFSDNNGNELFRINPSVGTFQDSQFISRRQYTSAFGFLTASSQGGNQGFNVRGIGPALGDKFTFWNDYPDDYFDVNKASTFRGEAKFATGATVSDWASLGPEKITNPSAFSSGNWTAGAGWDITNAEARKSSAGTGTLVQNVTSMVSAPVIGETYLLDITTSTYTAGASQAIQIDFLGKTYYSFINNGHHKFQFTATQNTGNITITPLATAQRFYINTISLKKVLGGNLNVIDTIKTHDLTFDGSIYANDSTFYFNGTSHNLNVSGVINSASNFSVNNQQGLTFNYTVVCNVDLVGLTKQFQNFTVIGGIITSNTTCQ